MKLRTKVVQNGLAYLFSTYLIFAYLNFDLSFLFKSRYPGAEAWPGLGLELVDWRGMLYMAARSRRRSCLGDRGGLA